MRAVIYARLSKNREGEKSATLKYQETRSREIAESEGWEVTSVLTDNDISGTKSDRPGYQQLKALVEAGTVDYIVCQDTDRLWRDDRESGPFRDLCATQGIDIRTWQGMEARTDNPHDRFTLTVTDAQAAMYAGMISKKVKDAHQRRLEEGRVNGGRKMFGEGSLAERSAVQRLAQMTLEGASLASMARWLNAEGFTTTRGNAWQSTTLKGLLTNPRLAGVLMYKGEEVGTIADYDPILGRETFEKVSAMLTHGKGPAKRGRPTRLCTTLLVCSTCGGRMTGGSNGKVKFYRCSNDNVCDGRQVVTAHYVDHHVWQVTVDHVRGLPEEKDDEGVDVGAVLGDIAALEGRLVEIDADYDSGVIDRKRYLARNTAITSQIEQLRGRLNGAARLTMSDLSLQDLLVPESRSPEAEHAVTARYEQMKAFLAEHVERVVVRPTTQHASRGFDTDRLEVVFK